MSEPLIPLDALITAYRDDPRMTKRKWVQWALTCAERVAHLNPDPRVQRALNAVRQWLASPTQENARRAGRATYAADAAYAAAYAAYAAAYAAADAARAARAAAYAAYAADAARAAAYREDPRMTKRKWVQWALACAERVAHHNPNPRVQQALDATRQWLVSPTKSNAILAAYAAGAADAVADAASHAPYVAYAAGAAAVAAGAADAADASRAASRAAADATYAAVSVARAAADATYAAGAADAAEEQWQALRLMEIYHEGEPI